MGYGGGSKTTQHHAASLTIDPTTSSLNRLQHYLGELARQLAITSLQATPDQGVASALLALQDAMRERDQERASSAFDALPTPLRVRLGPPPASV